MPKSIGVQMRAGEEHSSAFFCLIFSWSPKAKPFLTVKLSASLSDTGVSPYRQACITHRGSEDNDLGIGALPPMDLRVDFKVSDSF